MARTSAQRRPFERLLDIDALLLCRVRAWEVPRLTAIMRSLTHVGDTASWVTLGLLLFASGGQAHLHGRLLAAGAIISTLLAQALKRTCLRTRPSLGIRGFVALTENPDTFSFPSGHTAVAVGVAMALAGQGTFLGLLLGALALSIGVSRVYLGAHYPLDVGAGALLGAISGVLARALVL